MQAQANRIQSGWDVFGSDDQKIGEVSDVGPNYLILTKGIVFLKDIYVPFESVTSVDEGASCVYVAARKDDIESMGWDSPPAESAGSMGTAGSMSQDRSRTDTVADRDSVRVPVHEEELQTSKERREAGSVGVRKNVVEERQNVDVPVTHEEVTVRRVPAGNRTATDGNAFQDGGTVRVPVTAETVNVSKEPRVVEEVEISKRPVTETKRVSDTVRREEVEVDGDAVHDVGERELTGAGAGSGASSSISGAGDWDADRQTGITGTDVDDDMSNR